MTFGALLGIVFIVLKIVGTIEWSWMWVLSPIWIELCFWACFIVICYKVIKGEDERKDKITKRRELDFEAQFPGYKDWKAKRQKERNE